VRIQETRILVGKGDDPLHPNPHPYLFGELELCKECDYLGRNLWKLKYRLENNGTSDLFLYVRKLDGHGDFEFVNSVQHRNPHLCEWHYSTGESERRVPWAKMPDHEKVKVRLRAGESIESLVMIFSFDDGTPLRYTTFIGSDATREPTEIFSQAVVPVGLSNRAAIPGTEKPSYEIVNDICKPQCTIDLQQSPSVRGIRLGMSLADFRFRFPNVKVSKLREKLVDYKMVFLWERGEAPDVTVTLLNDVVARIEPRFRSLENARNGGNFYQLIAEKIGLTYFAPFGQGWRCKDFEIEITPNIHPSITIQTNEYLRVRDKLNEEAIRKLK